MIKKLCSGVVLLMMTLVACLPQSATQEGMFLPRWATPEPENLLMEYNGELVVEGNCLRIPPGVPEGERTFLVLWPSDYTLHVDNEQIEVFNGAGHVVARTTEDVYLVGGRLGAELVEPIGANLEGCEPPYWVAHEARLLEEAPR
jgi:hypothetical protein